MIPKPRLIGISIIRNEEDNYLRPWLKNMNRFLDMHIFLDDASTDNTPLIIQNAIEAGYRGKLFKRQSSLFAVDEPKLRSELWEYLRQIAKPNDWVLIVDADEFYDEKLLDFKSKIPQLNYLGYNCCKVSCIDIWGKNLYRIDNHWSPKYADLRLFAFQDIPFGQYGAVLHQPPYPIGINCNRPYHMYIPKLHFAYFRYRDRLRRYNFYKSHVVEPASLTHALSIFEKNSCAPIYPYWSRGIRSHIMSIVRDAEEIWKKEPDRPLVSIIIPVKNAAKFLARCLDSILKQTYPHLEIICVDNDSNDGSLELLKEYIKKDKRIVLLTIAQAGAGSARNAGIQYAHGEWIGFVDADDYIAPQTYEKAISNIQKDIDMICWGVRCVKDDSQQQIPWLDTMNHFLRLRFKGKKNFSFKVAHKTSVTVWNKLFRAEIIHRRKINFTEGVIFEDNAFFWKYFLYCQKVFFIPEFLYFYTQRMSSVMGALFRHSLLTVGDTITVGEDICRYYQTEGKFEIYKKYLEKIFLSIFFLEFDHILVKYRKELLQKGKKFCNSFFPNSRNCLLKAIIKGNTEVLTVRNKTSWLEKLFSIRYEQGKKIVNIIGFKFNI